ncbi:hypothetical protein HY768_06665 [candidate division TA06 bacterium]|uniref:Uncharacterized protein n=1 Tax=candidate division TA06 bacterium TaxID=2250710 RepID=A0A933MKN2_UNCT6|nr:hypothetical protein [candidate division TA06 bacterium]
MDYYNQFFGQTQQELKWFVIRTVKPSGRMALGAKWFSFGRVVYVACVLGVLKVAPRAVGALEVVVVIKTRGGEM